MGEQYQWIPKQSSIGKCYFFDNVTKDFGDTQENCQVVFGQSMSGKLTEPTSTDVYSEIVKVAKEKLPNKQVLTGFKKTDDSG